jgi:hypothetical protein
VIAVVIVVWRVILAAVLAGVLALLTSVSFWPAYLVCFSVLLVWGVFRWTRAVRGYPEYQRRLLDSHRPDGEQDWPGAGGVREPLPSGGRARRSAQRPIRSRAPGQARFRDQPMTCNRATNVTPSQRFFRPTQHLAPRARHEHHDP